MLHNMDLSAIALSETEVVSVTLDLLNTSGLDVFSDFGRRCSGFGNS